MRLLRGAADPNRLAILRRLQCGGSVAACDLNCCDVHQPTVSHHLRVLREAGWVRTERRASLVFYALERRAGERFLAIAGELLGESGRDPDDSAVHSAGAVGSRAGRR